MDDEIPSFHWGLGIGLWGGGFFWAVGRFAVGKMRMGESMIRMRNRAKEDRAGSFFPHGGERCR